MSTWQACINVKSHNSKIGNWDKSSELWKSDAIEQIWTTSGRWDWVIHLKSNVKSMDEVEKFVIGLHQQPWVSETDTCWYRKL